MKNRSNLISSCVVALLAGLIYYILSGPVDQKNISSEWTGEVDKTSSTDAAKIPQLAKGNETTTGNSYEWVTTSQKRTSGKKKFRVVNVNRSSVPVKENNQTGEGIYYASNNLDKAPLPNNLEVLNPTDDMDVSVYTEGEDTHIIIKNKRPATRNKNANTTRFEGEDDSYIRSEDVKIIVKDCTKSKTNKNTRSKNAAISPVQDPMTDKNKEEKINFGNDSTGTY